MIKHRQKKKIDNYSKNDKSTKHSDDDDELELYNMSKPLNKATPIVEKVVEEGDTLQSIAIRYRCTIEALKRLNNIHKENEIHAKPTIKVPDMLFPSALAAVHISGTSSPEITSISKTVDTVTLNNTLINLSNSAKTNEVNEIIFNTSIAQKNVEISSESTDEDEVHLLPQQPTATQYVIGEVITSRIKCSGDDGDISFICLIVCVILVIFIVPIIYVFYIAEHPEDFHHE